MTDFINAWTWKLTRSIAQSNFIQHNEFHELNEFFHIHLLDVLFSLVFIILEAMNNSYNSL